MARTSADHYTTLGVSPGATTAEIKAAYRSLVKRHHPDAGGDQSTILALNAAWEVLGDGERRRHYDHIAGAGAASRPAAGRAPAPRHRGAGAASDQELLGWLQQVYAPIDRLLGQVINPFPAQLRALAADPYDDGLMEAFCAFLGQSMARMEKVEVLYRSRVCPAAARGFGLSLYHCLSLVKDALVELERYTMGYVDSYLHDGKEMLREAKRRRSLLKEERRRLEL
ncbi:J domain-containing protein [Synechococcus sp. CCY 9618]|uniref:J domain-containing protein n=1 Tax=Synechococcus sp. CCY 9618 TaxID=2815602 RepID=UPI001C23D894|nr:J domain-containing protein [Synechococcus sp. CCY 9618]